MTAVMCVLERQCEKSASGWCCKCQCNSCAAQFHIPYSIPCDFDGLVVVGGCLCQLRAWSAHVSTWMWEVSVISSSRTLSVSRAGHSQHRSAGSIDLLVHEVNPLGWAVINLLYVAMKSVICSSKRLCQSTKSCWDQSVWRLWSIYVSVWTCNWLSVVWSWQICSAEYFLRRCVVQQTCWCLTPFFLVHQSAFYCAYLVPACEKKRFCNS